MKLATLVPLLALPVIVAWLPPLGAQTPAPRARAAYVEVERKAVGLRQGMTLDEVQTLLGKPRRTALRETSRAPGQPWQGTLLWTYAWAVDPHAGSDPNLRIEFAANTPNQWYVNSWEWSGH